EALARRDGSPAAALRMLGVPAHFLSARLPRMFPLAVAPGGVAAAATAPATAPDPAADTIADFADQPEEAAAPALSPATPAGAAPEQDNGRSLSDANPPTAAGETPMDAGVGEVRTALRGPHTNADITDQVRHRLRPPDEPPPLPVVADEEKYEVGHEVARGGLGRILEARDRFIDRSIAMKVMLDRSAAPAGSPESTASRSRFVEEARVTARLEHPNIVPIYEIGYRSDGRPFYTMKLIRGRTLGNLIKGLARGEPGLVDEYPLTRLLEVFLSVANGVEFAHARRIIHRDLKPDNVMVGEYGEVVILDWGLARRPSEPATEALDAPGFPALPMPPLVGGGRLRRRGARKNVARNGDAGSPPADGAAGAGAGAGGAYETGVAASPERDTPGGATKEGTVFGTPAYMSPEQARGEISRLDERSDIYSLGAILYEIVALRPPYEGESMDIIARVRAGFLRSPRETAGRRVPRELDAIVTRAMAHRQEDRYQSVKALRRDIRRFLEGRPVEALHEGPLSRAAKWGARHPTISAVTSVLLVLSAAFWAVAAGYGRAVREERLQRREQEVERDAAAQREREERRRAAERRALAYTPFRDARERLRRGDDPDKAVPLLTLALERDPTFAEALYERARVHHMLRRGEEAAADFRALRDLERDQGGVTARACFYLGHTYLLLLDDQEKAVAAFQEAARVDPGAETAPGAERDVYALLGGAIALMLEGRLDEAAAHASAVADRADYLWETHFVRAYILAAMTSDAEKTDRANPKGRQAFDLYSRVIELDPTNAWAFNNRGQLRHAWGEQVEAEADFKSALRTNRGYAGALVNLGVLLLRERRLEESRQLLEEAVRRHPRFVPAYLARASLLFETGDRPAALRDYDTAIDLQPGNVAALMNRATVKLALGAVVDARQDYDIVILYQPDHAGAHAARARLLAHRLGEPEAGYYDYTRALDAEPNNRDVRLERALLARDQLLDAARALEDFSRLVELAPDDPIYLTERAALFHLRLNDLPAAERDYQAAISLQKNNAEPYVGLGFLSLEQRRAQEAASNLLLAWRIRRDPSVAFHLYYLLRSPAPPETDPKNPGDDDRARRRAAVADALLRETLTLPECEPGTFPRLVADFLAGRVAETAFLEAAAKVFPGDPPDSPVAGRERFCQARFHAARRRALDGDAEGARALLREVAADALPDCLEYRLAKAELAAAER
ncbi:MAG: tetratricopeptide repeat protein, partial [Planctomycetes bacterium]|nr:tetratricopeptide repeat protein [Planctomycetota bacterium]